MLFAIIRLKIDQSKRFLYHSIVQLKRYRMIPKSHVLTDFQRSCMQKTSRDSCEVERGSKSFTHIWWLPHWCYRSLPTFGRPSPPRVIEWGPKLLILGLGCLRPIYRPSIAFVFQLNRSRCAPAARNIPQSTPKLPRHRQCNPTANIGIALRLAYQFRLKQTKNVIRRPFCPIFCSFQARNAGKRLFLAQNGEMRRFWGQN